MNHDGRVTTLLAGCRAEPLASYLKSLGLLRIVAEQVDPQASGWWEAATFAIRSTLDADALAAFLVEEYRPTPIVTPWNNGSGFGEEDEKKSPAAVAALRAIERSRKSSGWGHTGV